MSYFKRLGTTPYRFIGETTSATVANIFKRIDVANKNSDDFTVFYEYAVQDGDTPETLASKIYGTPYNHWIIYLINNIHNPYYDWPMSSWDFEAYIIKKYGSVAEAMNSIHHYEDANGFEVNATASPAPTSVSNYDYELLENEAKREIKLLRKEYVQKFITEFDKLSLGNT